MTPINDWVAPLIDWRDRLALPLWSTAGIDASTHSAWEALDHHGHPLPLLDRRQRVQFRQAFAFASNPQPDLQNLAWQLFRRTMDHGFDPDTGHLAAWVHPDLSHIDAKHDLYDLTFALLAAAALGHSGRDVAPDLARLDAAFDLLAAPLGWFEDAAHSLPRRQNPHMHLFEASTAAYGLTRAPKYRAMAQTCLEVFTTHVLQKDGQLLEFYGADWTPLSGAAQGIEPGHIAEWIYLADTFTAVTGIAHGLPLDRMWQAVQGHRLPSGFLPDQAGGQIRRLWPQTELLKAALVMEPAGAPQIAQTLWGTYMNTPVAGGWYDQFDESGTLLSNTMPTSTYYHISVAISACQSSCMDR